MSVRFLMKSPPSVDGKELPPVEYIEVTGLGAWGKDVVSHPVEEDERARYHREYQAFQKDGGKPAKVDAVKEEPPPDFMPGFVSDEPTKPPHHHKKHR